MARAGGAAGGEESLVISKMSKPPTRDNGSEASSSLVVVRPPTCALLFKGANYVGGRSLARSRCQSASPLRHAPCSLLQPCVIAPSSSFKVSSTLIFASCEARSPHSLRAKDPIIFLCPGMSYFFHLRQSISTLP